MKICVIGSGQMGQQIALISAIHGFQTINMDKNSEALERSVVWKNNYLENRLAKGQMTENQIRQVENNLRYAELEEDLLQDIDVVIEAVSETLEVKDQLFSFLDKVCKKETIFATNSSSIYPSKFQGVTNRPDKIIGMHFFNPALVIELVEVIKGPATSNDTVATIMQLSRDFGKDPILLKKEINGFVANRLMGRLFEEACRLIQNGIATPEEIDKAVEKGLRHPMGPCKLMDLVGMDTIYLLRVERYQESQDEIDKPQPLMKEMYHHNLLGIKTGEGFYKYNE